MTTTDKAKELPDCSGCTDRNSEGTHAMHTKQHPCPPGGDPNCGYCFTGWYDAGSECKHGVPRIMKCNFCVRDSQGWLPARDKTNGPELDFEEEGMKSTPNPGSKEAVENEFRVKIFDAGKTAGREEAKAEMVRRLEALPTKFPRHESDEYDAGAAAFKDAAIRSITEA